MMPLHHIPRESGVQHISVNISAVPYRRGILPRSRAQTKHSRAQKRRDDLYLPPGIVRHRPETERKNPGGPPRHHIREKVQGMASGIAGTGKSEVFVQKEELVSKAHHRGLQAAEPIGECPENVIEIDNNIGVQFPQPMRNEPY